MKPQSMLDEIHTFINTCVVNKTRKPMTENGREYYRKHLVFLSQWLRENHIPYELLTIDQMKAYLDSKETWSNSYKWGALCAARRFYAWRFSERHEVCSMRIRRIDPGPQRTLKEKQVKKLLEYFDTSTVKGIRDLAIVALLVDTGIRANELCSLTLDKLDMEDWTIDVLVKGGTWLPSAFFDFTARCLRQWLEIRPEIAQKGVRNVFVSIGGTKPGSCITRSGLRVILNKIGRNAGIGMLSPHDLRRTFATLAINNGAPSRVVQLNGHWRNIGMVERYTRKLSIKAIQPYSPVNNVMGIMRARRRDA